MIMKAIGYGILIFIFTALSALGQPKYELKDSLLNQNAISIYLLGNISFGYGATKISTQKVDAALNLAFLLTDKHFFVPINIRDSVALLLKNDGKSPTVINIAETLKVDYVVFAHVNQIQNMLRVDITLVNIKNDTEKFEGEGYSLIHFMKDENVPLYDPSLLSACQRALANALKDTNLYANADENFRVKPVPTLVIGGIEYINNPQYLPKWNIFERNIITAYDAIENIFEEARKSKDYVIYDTPSRDTIFALFNLLIVENYRPVSYHEIDALEKFGVKYYIHGKLTRKKDFSEVELSLSEIKNTNLMVLKTLTEVLPEDNMEQFRAILKEMTGKLLGIQAQRKK